MIWRPARDDDVPGIERFLTRHIQSSMFPLANLRDYGLRGADPRSMDIWVLGGNLRAVFAITNEGMVLPQCPDCSDQDLRDAIALIRGRPLFGIAAEAEQARRIIRLAGWQDRPATLNSDEPGYTLDLTRLSLPDAKNAEISPIGDRDRRITEDWRRAFLIEAMDFDADRALDQSRKDIASYIRRNSHRVLRVEGQPVGMCGFNARLPETAQIGGVYVPPELRGRGYARLAVGLHLQEAQKEGITRAVLFAASEAAARAYISLGFRPAGHYSLILFKNPKEAA